MQYFFSTLSNVQRNAANGSDQRTISNAEREFFEKNPIRPLFRFALTYHNLRGTRRQRALNRRLDGHERRSELCRTQKYLSLPIIKHRYSCCPARRLVTSLTELKQLASKRPLYQNFACSFVPFQQILIKQPVVPSVILLQSSCKVTTHSIVKTHTAIGRTEDYPVMVVCSLLDRFRRLSETSVTIYHTTRIHVPEAGGFHSYRSENLTSYNK
jgi:hypothetical protein